MSFASGPCLWGGPLRSPWKGDEAHFGYPYLEAHRTILCTRPESLGGGLMQPQVAKGVTDVATSATGSRSPAKPGSCDSPAGVGAISITSWLGLVPFLLFCLLFELLPAVVIIEGSFTDSNTGADNAEQLPAPILAGKQFACLPDQCFYIPLSQHYWSILWLPGRRRGL